MRYSKKQPGASVLAEQLKSGELKRVYTFYGEEEYLKRQYLQKLCRAVAGDSDFGITETEDSEYRLDRLIDEAENLSFDAAKKVIILRNIGADKIKNDKSELLKLFDGLFDEVTVVFYYDAQFTASDDYAKALARKKAIEAQSEFSCLLEFSKQTEGELLRWVKALLIKGGMSAGDGEARYLISLCGADMGKLKNEIDKLTLLANTNQSLTIELIDETVSPDAQANLFAMAGYIMGGNAKRLLEELKTCRINREKPIAVLAGISSAFCELSAVRAAMDSGIDSAGQVVKDFSLSPSKEWFIRDYFRLCKEVDSGFFCKALREILKAERVLKGGDPESWKTIELLCLRLLSLRAEIKSRSAS